MKNFMQNHFAIFIPYSASRFVSRVSFRSKIKLADKILKKNTKHSRDRDADERNLQIPPSAHTYTLFFNCVSICMVSTVLRSLHFHSACRGHHIKSKAELSESDSDGALNPTSHSPKPPTTPVTVLLSPCRM